MRSARARIAFCGLLALAIWEIGVLWSAARSVASDADWAAAAAAVRADFRAGDLVTFAPAWIDPVGRLWLGDLMRLEDAGRMDDARYARIWEVSVRGARTPGRTPGRTNETPAWKANFGAVTVRRFEQPAAVVRWDLRERGQLHEIDFEPRQCVPLFLSDTRPRLVLAIPRAELADELHVRAGLADVVARKRNRAVARLEVAVDGEVVTSGLVDAARGWSELPVVPTTPGPHRVTLRASVDREREPVDLRMCVAAESRVAS